MSLSAESDLHNCQKVPTTSGTSPVKSSPCGPLALSSQRCSTLQTFSQQPSLMGNLLKYTLKSRQWPLYCSDGQTGNFPIDLLWCGSSSPTTHSKTSYHRCFSVYLQPEVDSISILWIPLVYPQVSFKASWESREKVWSKLPVKQCKHVSRRWRAEVIFGCEIRNKEARVCNW